MTTTGPRQSETATQLGGALSGLVRTMRPRHWVKNVVVLAAPAASGTLFEPPVLAAVGIAFVAFSLAAAGVYIVNDIQDVDADRAHPIKCHRPIAAALVSPRLALTVAVALFATAVGVSFLASVELVLVTVVYLAVQ